MIKKIESYFTKGNERSIKAKQNIIISLFVKGGSIVVSFLLVPLILNYLDKSKYGIWLTISSFIGWFNFLGIGFGNGLRNYLAESFAKNDFIEAKKYVSTTYIAMTIIFSVIGFLFVLINQFLDWNNILNTTLISGRELHYLALIVFEFFFLRFVFKLITIILYADQRPAFANSLIPISNLIALIVIWILTKISDGNLIYLGLVLSSSSVVVFFVVSVYLFRDKYKSIRPSLHFFHREYINKLLNLGMKFFIIQVSGVVLYQTSNFIIIQFFGPSQVTIYNIAYKYLFMVNMVFFIILSPFWSAFTEAWINKDFSWIKMAIKKLEYVWLMMVFFLFILIIFSDRFYMLWVGEKVRIPLKLTIIMGGYIAFLMASGLYAAFLNGISKTKVQLYFSLFAAFFFVIITLLQIKILKFGIESVPISLALVSMLGTIIVKVQVTKILNNQAKGIWVK